MPLTRTQKRRHCTNAAFFLLMAAFLSASGCGLIEQKEPDLPYTALPDPATLPPATGGHVLSVKGEAITVAEIVDAVRTMLRPDITLPEYQQFQAAMKPRVARFVHSRIAEVVVYQEAKREFDASFDDKLEQAVETEIRRFVSTFHGDYAAADRELARQNLTWQAFRDLQRRQIITQTYIQTQLGDPKPVTHSDLMAFYDSIKDAEYKITPVLEVRVISIRPEDMVLTDPNQDRLLAAKDLAVTVAARARGGEDFAALAARYSGDHGRDRGGLWNPIEPGSLAPPYDVIEKTAVEMEPGAISDPVFAGGYFFIIRLERKQVSGHIPFEEVQHDIQRRLNQSRREQAFDTIMRKRLDMTKIGDIDKFVEACVAALYADLQRVTPPSGSSQ